MGPRLLANASTLAYLSKASGPIAISEAADCDYAANRGSSGACADQRIFSEPFSSAVSAARNATND